MSNGPCQVYVYFPTMRVFQNIVHYFEKNPKEILYYEAMTLLERIAFNELLFFHGQTVGLYYLTMSAVRP